jgi:hypothetical protein
LRKARSCRIHHPQQASPRFIDTRNLPDVEFDRLPQTGAERQMF